MNILNILTGSFLDTEQDEKPAVLRDETHFSDERLADDEWKNHPLLEEPIGSMLTANVDDG